MYFYCISLLSCFCFVHEMVATCAGIRSFFGGTPYTQVVEKDYLLDAQGSFNLQNIEGSITVRPGLDKKSVALRATKYTNCQEHLEHMHVIEERVHSNELSLRSAYDYEKLKGRIDYVVTVPESVSLRLSTHTGMIQINGIKGAMDITVAKGNVTVTAPEGPLNITITQRGDVLVVDPKAAVDVQLHTGDVYITDSYADVAATVMYGDLSVQTKVIKKGSVLNLSVQTGDIILRLPEGTQAGLHALAERGTITTDQVVTVREHETILDAVYWKQVQKEVYARIGKQENAQIELRSNRGDIWVKER